MAPLLHRAAIKIAKKFAILDHHATLLGHVFATKAHIDSREKLVKQQYLLQMAPANFNGFRVLAALLHGIPVVGVSQTLWH